MNVIMGLAAVGSFLTAIFTAAFVVSDIQLIIVEMAVIGGFLLAGMSAVLSRISPPTRPPREEPRPRSKHRGLRGLEDTILGPRDSEKFGTNNTRPKA